MKSSPENSALILGATGLVGSHLLSQLIASGEYSRIHVAGRRMPEGYGKELTFFQADLLTPETLPEAFAVEVVFCCLGTTRKQAGSNAAFRQVDFDMVVRSAAFARTQGAHTLVVISSIGADDRSLVYYSKVKGEVEAALTAQNWPRLVIVRPSLLLGDRKETRLGEKIGESLFHWFRPLMKGSWAKYAAIEAADVARAMASLARMPGPGGIFESDALQSIADAKK